MNYEKSNQENRTRFFLGRLLSAIGAELTFTMLFTALTLPERREPYIPLVLVALGVSSIVFCIGLTMSILYRPGRKLKEALHAPMADEIRQMQRASRSMLIGSACSLVLAALFFFGFRLLLPGIFLTGFSVYLGMVSRGFRRGSLHQGKGTKE